MVDSTGLKILPATGATTIAYRVWNAKGRGRMEIHLPNEIHKEVFVHIHPYEYICKYVYIYIYEIQ